VLRIICFICLLQYILASLDHTGAAVQNIAMHACMHDNFALSERDQPHPRKFFPGSNGLMNLASSIINMLHHSLAYADHF
jgi:hypothetical protein